REEMLRANPGPQVIGIGRVTAAYVDCADAEAHFASLEEVEVHEPYQGCPQRTDVVDAQGARRAVGHECRRRYPWNKKARHAHDGTQCGTCISEVLVQRAEEWRRHYGDARRYAVPRR